MSFRIEIVFVPRFLLEEEEFRDRLIIEMVAKL